MSELRKPAAPARRRRKPAAKGRRPRAQAPRKDTVRRNGDADRQAYELLARCSRDIILQVHPVTGRILEANPAASLAYGYSRDELLALTIFNLRVDPAGVVSQQMTEAGKDGILFQSIHRRKDGGVFPVEVSSQGVTLNGECVLISVVRDITVRHRMEIELTESRARFVQMAENITEVFWLANADLTEMLYVSPAYVDIWGRSCESLYNNPRSWADAVHADDAAQVYRAFMEQRAAGHDLHQEYRIVRPDGSIRWIDDHGFPIRDANGVVFRIAGRAADITERKRSEQSLAVARDALARANAQLDQRVRERTRQLADSETNFHAFFETMTDLVFVGGLDGRILMANGAVSRKLGYSAGELAAMSLADVHPPALRQEAETIVAAMLRGERETCPLPLARKDGSLLPVETRIWLGQWNGQKCLFGVCKDMTSEMEAEQRFEGLFRHNPAVMALSSLPDRRFTDVNDAFLAVIGYARTEVIGRTAVELGLFPDAEQHLVLGEKLLADGSVSGVELHVRCKDGSVRTGIFCGEVIRSRGGTYFLTVMIDVTAIRLAQRELKEERQRLAGIIRGTNVGTWEWNVQTGATVFNARWAEIIGYTLDELGPVSIQTWIDFCHPDDLKVSGDLLQKHFRGEVDYYECEARMRHKHGHWVWVLDRGMVTTWTPEGQPLLMMGTHQDITARKEAEQALKQSEAKLRSLFAAMPDVIFVLDHEGRYIEVAPTNPKLLYRPPEEVLGKRMHDLFPRPQADQFLEYVRWALRTRQPQTLDYALQIGGQEVFFSSTVSPMDAERVIFVARDVTQRRLAEEALRASEERYRTLFNGSGDAIFVRRLAGDDRVPFVEVNETACKWFGYTRDELLKMSPRDLSPQDISYSLAENSLRVAAGEPVTVECPVRTRDGRQIPVEISMQPFLLNGEHFALDVMRDLTERKRAEEDILKLSSVVQQSPAAVMVTDTRARITYVNPAFEQITGYAATDAFGKNPRFLQSGRHPREHYAQLWAALLAGQVWHGEFCNRRKSGELYWESASIAPVRNANGEVSYYVAIKEDITRTKQTERELIEAKTAAEAANRAKSAFLANMSHEIRTPMNSVLGFAQLLLGDASLSPRQRRQVESINRGGEHLLALINDVLEMSRIEAGRVTLQPTLTSLPSLLQDLEAMFRLRAREKGLFLQIDRTADALQGIVVDAKRLLQILINLLSNAVKFTVTGGITVRAVKVLQPDRTWRLVFDVADTGPGISETDQARLFRHFEQTKTGHEAMTGTGLGLAISRGLARIMGGELTVRSTPGQGSVFILSIPVGVSETACPAPAGPAPRVGRLASAETRRQALIVDDIPANCEILVEMLTRVGFDTRTASDGESAVETAASWHPHLILMDLRLPRMDGYQAIQRIREREQREPGARAVIVAITAYAMVSERDKALQAGADGYISKPFRETDLFAMLQQTAGLRFLPDDQDPEAAPETPVAPVPDVMRAGLCDAAERGDYDDLIARAEELKKTEPRTAALLKELAERFEYEKILSLLQPRAAEALKPPVAGSTTDTSPQQAPEHPE